MPSLTKDQILVACAREVVAVDVPALGGSMFVRALSGAEAGEVFQDSSLTDVQRTQQIVTLSICDEAGKRLFTRADTDTLYDKPFMALDGLIAAALKANRMTKEASDDARKG